MNDNYEDDSHVNSVINEADSCNGKTTGARHENSAQYMTKPTRHFFIRYKINDTDAWKKVKVKSVQPKKTGK